MRRGGAVDVAFSFELEGSLLANALARSLTSRCASACAKVRMAAESPLPSPVDENFCFLCEQFTDPAVSSLQQTLRGHIDRLLVQSEVYFCVLLAESFYVKYVAHRLNRSWTTKAIHAHIKYHGSRVGRVVMLLDTANGLENMFERLEHMYPKREDLKDKLEAVYAKVFAAHDNEVKAMAIPAHDVRRESAGEVAGVSRGFNEQKKQTQDTPVTYGPQRNRRVPHRYKPRSTPASRSVAALHAVAKTCRLWPQTLYTPLARAVAFSQPVLIQGPVNYGKTTALAVSAVMWMKHNSQKQTDQPKRLLFCGKSLREAEDAVRIATEMSMKYYQCTQLEHKEHAFAVYRPSLQRNGRTHIAWPDGCQFVLTSASVTNEDPLRGVSADAVFVDDSDAVPSKFAMNVLGALLVVPLFIVCTRTNVALKKLEAATHDSTTELFRHAFQHLLC